MSTKKRRIISAFKFFGDFAPRKPSAHFILRSSLKSFSSKLSNALIGMKFVDKKKAEKTQQKVQTS